MSEGAIDERLARVEQIVDVLLRHVNDVQRKKDWRRTVGIFDDDPIMQEIIDEGLRIREEDRIETA